MIPGYSHAALIEEEYGIYQEDGSKE